MNEKDTLQSLCIYLKDILQSPSKATLTIESLPEEYRELANMLLLLRELRLHQCDSLSATEVRDTAQHVSCETIASPMFSIIEPRLSVITALLEQASSTTDNRSIINETTNRFSDLVCRLIQISNHDELTGLYNKHAFAHFASGLISSNPNSKYNIIRWDINRFKVFNYLYGAKEGDSLLKYIADNMNAYFDDSCVTARLESDHFVVCAPTNKYQPSSVIAKVVEWVDSYSTDFAASATFGIYPVSDISVAPELMCDRALFALKTAKHNPAKNFAYYDNNLSSSMLKEQAIINQMEAALEQGQFEMFLQPQYKCDNKNIVGAEALARWNHPEQGYLSPATFIPIFEKNGFIFKLDEKMWDLACSFLRKLIDKYGIEKVVPISVNISRIDLYNTQLISKLNSVVKKYRLPKNLLKLEITESAYMDNPSQLIEAVKKLQASGFTVEMDDFGSGYSSLNTLKDVCVDVLKLDLNFLSSSENAERSGSILSSVMRMARWLKLPVIAEGVENEKQFEYLKSIGCDYVQGYLFSKPIPADNFEKLLISSETDELTNRYMQENFDDVSNFWNANEQTTLIFNTYVGGAAIFEYSKDNLEALRVNDKYYEVLQTTKDVYSAYQLNVFESIYEEDRDAYRKMLKKAISTGKEAECETRRHSDHNPGKFVYVKTIARVLAKNGDTYLFYAMVENITDKVQTAQALQETSTQLQAIMDETPGGIVLVEVSDTAKVLFFNKGTAALLDYTEQELQSLSTSAGIESLIYPVDVPKVMQQNSITITTGKPTVCEYRSRKKDGTLIWIRANISLLRQKTSPSPVIMLLLLDITEEKNNGLIKERQRDIIENHHSYLKNLWNSVQCGIMQYSMDDRATILAYNKTAAKIFGYKTYDAMNFCLGKSIYDLLPESDRALFKNALTECQTQCKLGDYEIRIIKADGEIGYTRSITETVISEKGEQVIQDLFLDVTDYRKMVLEKEQNRYQEVMCLLYDTVGELDTEKGTYKTLFFKPTSSISSSVASITEPLPISTCINMFVHPENKAAACSFFNIKALKKLCGDKSACVSAKFRALFEDAQYKWIKVTLIAGNSANKVLFCLENIDATEREQRLTAENETLRAQISSSRKELHIDELYELLLEDSAITIFDYDPENDFMELTQKAEGGEIKTASYSNYMKKVFPSRSLVDERTYQDFLKKMKDALSFKTKSSFKFTGKAKDGTIANYDLRYTSIADAFGKIFRVIGRLYVNE